ncbi:MAG TPA: hypothetical protein V6D15_14870 [Oculatellaceae cyanobacterium]|jgi:hypothetical protein
MLKPDGFIHFRYSLIGYKAFGDIRTPPFLNYGGFLINEQLSMVDDR